MLFAKYYQIPPEAILIAHDELDFPAGTVRLKKGGGHGGHNGLRDIMQHLNSDGFYRLRLGIGQENGGVKIDIIKETDDIETIIEEVKETSFDISKVPNFRFILINKIGYDILFFHCCLFFLDVSGWIEFIHEVIAIYEGKLIRYFNLKTRKQFAIT